MSDLATTNQAQALEQVLIKGDLSVLTSEQKVFYYNKVCESLNLNPLTRPFEYIELNRKLTLYTRKECTDQLRTRDHISLKITSREVIGDIYVVTAQAKNKDGREEESTGCVPIANLKGDGLANAYMKAETKAKRRVTLSICGLGMLDETEVESINHETPKVIAPPKEVEDTKKGLLRLLGMSMKENQIGQEKMREYCKKTFGKENAIDLIEDELEAAILWIGTPKAIPEEAPDDGFSPPPTWLAARDPLSLAKMGEKYSE